MCVFVCVFVFVCLYEHASADNALGKHLEYLFSCSITLARKAARGELAHGFALAHNTWHDILVHATHNTQKGTPQL